MLHAKAPLVTRHDYQDMPEGPPYFQVIEGELVGNSNSNERCLVSTFAKAMKPCLFPKRTLTCTELFRSENASPERSLNQGITSPDTAARWEYAGPLQTPCWSPSIRARPGAV